MAQCIWRARALLSADGGRPSEWSEWSDDYVRIFASRQAYSIEDGEGFKFAGTLTPPKNENMCYILRLIYVVHLYQTFPSRLPHFMTSRKTVDFTTSQNHINRTMRIQ